MKKKSNDCGGDDTTVLDKKKTGHQYLPHDLIVDEILTKLPVPTLLTSVLVSKLWYNSIQNDHKRLTYSHFLESQKRPDVIFSLLNVRDGVVDQKTGLPKNGCYFFKFTPGICSRDQYALKFDKFRGDLAHHHVWELVGYRNGLPCMALVGKYATVYIVLDPNRDDYICIFYPARVGKRISNACIICHGFGFDPSTNEYKLVSIFRTAEKELNIVVFTLGTKSWRNITATSMAISGHGGRPVIKLRAPTGSDKSAIFCTSSSGCLVWKIITTLWGAGSDISNEMEMLLSFNLHDEKFRFIQLPAKSTTNKQQKHLLVDYPHLLEFKGFPCIARIEKNSENGSDDPHRCCIDHKDSSNCCCCCCKVHLYVLKDQVKQVWVKEESFNVRTKSNPLWLKDIFPLATDPCLFPFGGATTRPPTRIFSFSDQMLLYWFNGYYLQTYNLRSEKLEVVLPYDQEGAIFGDKRKEPRQIYNSGEDADNCSSDMDYQLHCHEENFLCLGTFKPEGVEGVEADVFNELYLKREDHPPCWAFVYIHRSSDVFYPFS